MAKLREKHLKRVLGGGLFSLAIILAILWILAFAVGQIKSDEFIPFVSIVSWIALMVFVVNWLMARHLKKLDILKLNQVKSDARLEYPPTVADLLPHQGWEAPPSSVAEQTTEQFPQGVTQQGGDSSSVSHAGK
jgi:hypothetical protein